MFNCCELRCYNPCCCEPRCCNPCCCCPGPRGLQGIQGIQGPQGIPGPAFNTYGSFYESTAQTINTGVPITLTQTISANNLALNLNGVFIPTTGAYLVNYGINTALNAVAGNNIYLAVNGVAITGTERAVSVAAGTNSSAILFLTAGDFLTLMPTATAVAVTNIGGASANLSLTRIA